MTTLVIGDIHGRPIWKRLVRGRWDRIVFLGDYFDSHESFSPPEQLYNFREIVALKDAEPDRVVLLVGNHDYHYIMTGEYYSGFQQRYADQIGQMILGYQDALQACTMDQGWLLSHAGVTTSWMRHVHLNDGDTVEVVNEAWLRRRDVFRFNLADREGYGDHPLQGPLWVRPKTLMAVPAYPKQIVGHTYQKTGVFQRVFRDEAGAEVSHFVFADALPRQFVTITDGRVEACNVSGYSEPHQVS